MSATTFKFETLDYQKAAVDAVCNVFKGQDHQSERENKLFLSVEDMIANINKVQGDLGLPRTESKPTEDEDYLKLTLELETGTGKTFVAIWSILELNKHYGFNKFVIVVPSVAIKNGFVTSFDEAKEYFRSRYKGIECNAFLYDSGDLEAVQNFVNSSSLQVMIATKQSINNVNAIFNAEQDRLSGMTGRQLVSSIRPIVFLDEPQSLTGDRTEKAIRSLSPLLTVGFSATHKDANNMVYKLGPIEASKKNLVKSVAVESTTASDDITEEQLQRIMVKATIINHLDKMVQVKNSGKNIKVLSLFFINAVDDYRNYEEEDRKGQLAKIFEQEFIKEASNPKYKHLFDSVNVEDLAGRIHEGYFSKDKTGRDTNGENEAAYDLIIKNKKALLDSATPQSFIFSHTALKEGWDNPNVFQICVLGEMGEERWRRQIIGRGLRLPVAKTEDNVFTRVKDSVINEVTLVVKEEFKKFVNEYQKEMEKDGVEFNKISENTFTTLRYEKVQNVDGVEIIEQLNLSQSESKEIFDWFRAKNWVNRAGKFSADFEKTVQEDGEIELPEKFSHVDDGIRSILKSKSGLDVRDKSSKDQVENCVDPSFTSSKNFEEFFERVKHKTMFSLDEIKGEEFLTEFERVFASKLEESNLGKSLTYTIEKTQISLEQSGVVTGTTEKYLVTDDSAMAYNFGDKECEMLEYIQSKTGFELQFLCNLFSFGGASNLGKYLSADKEELVTLLLEAKNITMTNLASKGNIPLEYDTLKAQEFAEEDCEFSKEEIYNPNSVVTNDTLTVRVSQEKTGQTYIRGGSNVEKHFTEECQSCKNVETFFKLHSEFKIETPIGSYNADWAVVTDIESKRFLVHETKGSTTDQSLRGDEKLKIECAKKHFKAVEELKIESPINYTKGPKLPLS